jgi:hypothetical protein
MIRQLVAALKNAQTRVTELEDRLWGYEHGVGGTVVARGALATVLDKEMPGWKNPMDEYTEAGCLIEDTDRIADA